jgi:asparagine synthase (glutamine-hydrolysing)
MCGIHGFIAPKRDQQSSRELIERMVRSTLHRGPDHSETVALHPAYLGHNRLSIIDLHAEANQPMHFGKHWIVFNGEIYNYKELREELLQKGITFTTSSDTEVVLKSFALEGEKCVEKFIGMWAFAIYDEDTHDLFCSRDRFGIKPFNYIHSGNELYFSSEIKSLRQTPVFSNELNLNQIGRGLQLGWVGFEDQTYFESVKQLEPGCNLIFSKGKLEIKNYWSYPSEERKISLNDAVHQFRDLFNDSLKLHVRSDVPIGATLSGGIDSSSIVCSMLNNGLSDQLKTFSIYYEGTSGFDERPFIETIREKYSGKFDLNYYSPNDKEIAEDFHTISHTMDVPLSGSSPISQYYVMKLAAKHDIKVILSGQGADDYMGGYMHAYYRSIAQKARTLQFGKALSELKNYRKIHEASGSKLLNLASKSALSAIMNEDALYKFEYFNYFPFMLDQKQDWEHFEPFNSGKLNSFHYALMKYSSLPTLLHYEDRNSMAHSIESRVPFLDHRLVELLFTVPDELKMKDGWTKYILRSSMEKVLPEQIQWRTDKKGFVTPGEILWLRGPLSHLLDIDLKRMPFINKERAEKVLKDFKKGDNSKANLVWRLASLHHWLKEFN